MAFMTFAQLPKDIQDRVNNLLAGLYAGGMHKSYPHEAKAIEGVINAAVDSGFIDKSRSDDGKYVILSLSSLGIQHISDLNAKPEPEEEPAEE
jgi:hypothetical protein